MNMLWIVPEIFIAGLLVAAGAVFRVRLWVNLGVAMAICIVLIFAVIAANARDAAGIWANSPLKPWFDGLRSGRGPCCSDADGSAISDVDWESRDGHYRVRIEGEWINVPDDAVITEPNRAGRAMVWPMRGYMGLSIRCFMPGPAA